MLNYNGKLKHLARNLRSNMTEEETILWAHIRNKKIKDTSFYRQKIIGNYIVDFYSSKAGLIIEVDGGGHYNDEYVRKDGQRDLFLKKQGFKVLRISNLDIRKNLDGVLTKIYEEV